jgi:hypothetical protein
MADAHGSLTGRCTECGQMFATCDATTQCADQQTTSLLEPLLARASRKPPARNPEVAPLLSGTECDACGEHTDCGCTPLDLVTATEGG